MNEKEICQKIKKYNLYPNNIKTYVELFTDGSYFFWNKEIAFTQFINDVNGKLNKFYKSIRENRIIPNSIYCQHQPFTKDIEEIINSNFYKRLDRTYIFDRDYKNLIKATDSKSTLFYCQKSSFNSEIIEQLSKVEGKLLIVTEEPFETNWNVISDNYYFVTNYKIDNFKQELF